MITPYPGQRRQEGVSSDVVAGKYSACGGRCALLSERDHQVLDRDIVVFEPLGLALGGLKHPRQARGDRYLARRRARTADLGSALQFSLQICA